MNHAPEHDELLLPGIDVEPSRRAFLQLAGFGIAAATLTGCSRHGPSSVLTWSSAPEDVVAGRAWWVATTCGACPSACGALARCRDGRPVKLEGNELNPIGAGGLCAVGQASLLELFDSHRLKGPLANSAPTTWEELDAGVGRELEARRAGGRVRILTGTIHSPSTLAAIERFRARFADARHVMYDALSMSAVLDAHERTHGTRVLPRMRFDRASVIAAFDADFLGTWLAPVDFAGQYASSRGLAAKRSRHVHFEARLSLTGARADKRVLLAPSETRAALERLCLRLAEHAGERGPEHEALSASVAEAIDALAADLWRARGESLVVSGANDVECQVLVNEANHRLASYGSTLDIERPSLQRRGDDRALVELGRELESGSVDVLIVAGCNPAHELPPELSRSLTKAKTLIACAAMLDETAALARWVAPDPHYLESWNDSEPVTGCYGLTQPAVPALRDTRTLRRALWAWMGDARDDHELLKDHWKTAIWPRLGAATGFDAFFHKALHDGAVELESENLAAKPGSFRGRGTGDHPQIAPYPGGELTLTLHAQVAMPDGAHANNPWLQELPDPITKTTWGNHACVSPALAKRQGLVDGDIVRVTAAGSEHAIELPVIVQRGQLDGIVAVALGYGRAGTERFANIGPKWMDSQPTVAEGQRVGANAAPFLALVDGYLRGDVRAVRLARTGVRVELARTQDYDSLTLPASLAPHGHEEREHVHHVMAGGVAATAPVAVAEPERAHANESLWPDDHPRAGAQWGMVIDLDRCTGCAACVIACQAENNVPVVGRDEIVRHREMHWLRIDRYLQGEGSDTRVELQPMLCQHCGNAPCEAVCPVLATVHSAEGLNQQVYNRCVGTRYCANTCPYKVRRFNWFDYLREDRLQNHALNPDVTVRSRGVMEKCSFCVQRIQEAKLEARRSGQPLPDRAVRTACEQSCPAQAIRFGDLANASSAVAKAAADARAYTLLEELNVRPSIRYLARVSDGARTQEPQDG